MISGAKRPSAARSPRQRLRRPRKLPAPSASATAPVPEWYGYLFYSPLITGFQGIARSLAAGLALGIRLPLLSLVLVFCLVTWIYGRDRLVDENLPETADSRSLWIARHRNALRGIQKSAAFGAALTALCLPRAWPLIALILLLALAYTKPILPKGHSFKQLPGFKSPFVALVWTLLAIGLPLTASGARTNPLAVATVLFLQLFAVVSINDIYDIADDRRKGIASIAVLMGEGGARALAALAAGIAGGFALFGAHSAGLALGCLYLAAYAAYVRAARGRDHGPTMFFYRASSFATLLFVSLLG
jgi:4-hydroxybenzoate polyprenyltransferase